MKGEPKKIKNLLLVCKNCGRPFRGSRMDGPLGHIRRLHYQLIKDEIQDIETDNKIFTAEERIDALNEIAKGLVGFIPCPIAINSLPGAIRDDVSSRIITAFNSRPDEKQTLEQVMEEVCDNFMKIDFPQIPKKKKKTEKTDSQKIPKKSKKIEDSQENPKKSKKIEDSQKIPKKSKKIEDSLEIPKKSKQIEDSQKISKKHKKIEDSKEIPKKHKTIEDSLEIPKKSKKRKAPEEENEEKQHNETEIHETSASSSSSSLKYTKIKRRRRINTPEEKENLSDTALSDDEHTFLVIDKEYEAEQLKKQKKLQKNL